MTYEEAKKEADKTGGMVGWSVAKGYHVVQPWRTQAPPIPLEELGWGGAGYKPPAVEPKELTPEEEFRQFMLALVGEKGKTLSYEEALAQAQRMGPGYYVVYDPATGGYTIEGQPPEPSPEMSEWQQAQMELAQQEAQRAYEQQMWERQQTGVSDVPQWRPGELGLQQQYLALEQQQAAQEQQNYLAQMAAQPKSWLEYAAASGQPPVVQPWMLPLMPQQYPELAGLQAGQPVPGWPSQFAGTTPAIGAGTQVPTTTGTMPSTGAGTPAITAGTPSGIDALTAQHPLGSKGAYPGFPQGIPPELAQGPLDYKDYVKMAQQGEMASYYATDLLRRQWEMYPETKPTVGPGLYTSALGVTHPEIAKQYTQAQTAAASGQPLLSGLDVQGKFDLVEQLIRQGMDRTLAERQVFGGSKTFAPYTPISDITGVAPTTPTIPYTPTPTPIEELAPTPKKKTTPSYTPTSIPMEESMGNVRAYIPGRSWHMIDPKGIKPNSEDTNWLGRVKQMETRPQEYNPASYAAGSWAGYNPSLPLGQMPTLTRPSRQYQARMGPTALDQYYTYVQARTGITPQEMQFRLWSMSPPGGRFGGLRYTR